MDVAGLRKWWQWKWNISYIHKKVSEAKAWVQLRKHEKYIGGLQGGCSVFPWVAIYKGWFYLEPWQNYYLLSKQWTVKIFLFLVFRNVFLFIYHNVLVASLNLTLMVLAISKLYNNRENTQSIEILVKGKERSSFDFVYVCKKVK